MCAETLPKILISFLQQGMVGFCSFIRLWRRWQVAVWKVSSRPFQPYCVLPGLNLSNGTPGGAVSSWPGSAAEWWAEGSAVSNKLFTQVFPGCLRGIFSHLGFTWNTLQRYQSSKLNKLCGGINGLNTDRCRRRLTEQQYPWWMFTVKAAITM